LLLAFLFFRPVFPSAFSLHSRRDFFHTFPLPLRRLYFRTGDFHVQFRDDGTSKTGTQPVSGEFESGAVQ
jgi:hypothetical protein